MNQTHNFPLEQYVNECHTHSMYKTFYSSSKSTVWQRMVFDNIFFIIFPFYFWLSKYMAYVHIGGVMISVLALIAVDPGFEP